MKTFALVLASLLLAGCVGGYVFTPTVTVHPSPGIALSEHRAEITKSPANQVEAYNKDRITKLWGLPDSVEKTENGERWQYVDGYMWCGVMPVLVIPVPLVIPFGRRHTILDFNGNDLTKIEQHHEEGKGGMCGIVNPHTLFGCV